ncbi:MULTISPECIES: fluoride efflux transporter CrcB [Gibbsiella]|nr:fluoride efflux transporter CrcB [Gibbsiella quercinecans]
MFNAFLAVFIGGGLGSALRWAMNLKLNPLHAHIPLGTLAVNLVGCFIIGLAMALFMRMNTVDPTLKLLITTGFCGGLTTFSAFSFEVIYLLQDGRFAWALANVALNLLGSLAMTLLAFLLISWIGGR